MDTSFVPEPVRAVFKDNDYIPGMSGFLISVLWTVPFIGFEWLGLVWYWAALASIPVIAVGYWLYFRWLDNHG